MRPGSAIQPMSQGAVPDKQKRQREDCNQTQWKRFIDVPVPVPVSQVCVPVPVSALLNEVSDK
jgi:hypothetical protein